MPLSACLINHRAQTQTARRPETTPCSPSQSQHRLQHGTAANRESDQQFITRLLTPLLPPSAHCHCQCPDDSTDATLAHTVQPCSGSSCPGYVTARLSTDTTGLVRPLVTLPGSRGRSTPRHAPPPPPAWSEGAMSHSTLPDRGSRPAKRNGAETPPACVIMGLMI